MSGSDKRAMERFELELQAEVLVDEQDGEAAFVEMMTENICAGGVYLKTEQPLPVGAQIKMKLVLPLDELKNLTGRRALIQVTGAVVRKQNDGMAVCFNKNYQISPI